ncbi:mucosa-associated lymphoid tissue lymphoma translocation protein 1-like isoform X2 [Ascaphus truei]|uniref:mucosa-associated lymphoid tissue lymphoma translocation protein 1-like isoform X2 n=1 Tax=Ascaphus truei TaxID=8439 RepID=UPI003F5A619A
MLKDIVITEQPLSACVPADVPLTLHCRAHGPSPLNYQWFQQRESSCKEIPGAKWPDLDITTRETQLYICRINNQHHNIAYSCWVKVKVLRDFTKACIPARWEGEPVIVTNPTPAHLRLRHPVLLQCCAIGIPAPQYQWYHNGNCLPHERKKELLIESAKESHSGSYLCCVSNARGERWSEPVELNIEGEIVLHGSPQTAVIPGRGRTDRCCANGKVALLIGNNGYLKHPNLLAPMVDVCELSVQLRTLGFCVVSLVDLTRAEMLTAVGQFLQFLQRGAYGLFYYAGHGYERSGRNYMVPIDAPQPYRPENCISVQNILQRMQERKTALNVVLLDTCRKWYNSDCALSKVTPTKPWGNTVYGYATEDAEAYEVQDGEFSSGIFMKYLKKHILEDKKVTHMLEDVLEDIGRDPLVMDKQVMEIKHTLKEARALTDTICTTGSAAEYLRQWDQCSELPHRMVTFPCGVEADLSFQVVFSNLTHAFAKLTKTPPHLADIRILLYKPSDMAELSLTSDHVDSLLAIDEDADCMLRLHGLQRSQNDIIIKVDLHCTRLDTGVRMQESIEHKIQKPWIARLFSGKDTPSLDRITGACATPQDSKPITQPRPTTSSTSNGAHSLKAMDGMPFSGQSKSSSEPEENDESDAFTAVSPSRQKDSSCSVRKEGDVSKPARTTQGGSS